MDGADPLLDVQQLEVTIGDGAADSSIPLTSFAALLEAQTQWGFVVHGADARVHGGPWSGTIEEVMAQVGAANDLSVDVDEEALVVTLTYLGSE